MSATSEPGVLGPVIALNLWTFAIEGLMFSRRLPAISKHKIPMDSSLPKDQLAAKYPPFARWSADNFNHLMEQPTQFYAVALAIAFLHERKGSKVDVALAWTYVGLRVLHSLVQVSKNNIPVRFMVFATSSLSLLGLTASAARLVF
ncbi:MAPEG superfamily domain-containing protein [Histoplasma ohiense]|nr:MAPEG superfamily domain-containing protein [Histoplasma ohiense (nom. inval.)]